MYPNFPHDDFEQHNDTCMRSIEGDQTHLRIQREFKTLSLTANVELDQEILFSTIFTPNTTPFVYPTLSSVGVISAKINVVAKSISNAGFTLQAYSDQTQSITVEWLAIGKAE